MCLLIVEILMFIAGLGAILAGKLPEILFKVHFGKDQNDVEPLIARLYGLFLASPLPLAMMIDWFLGVGDDAAPEIITFASLLELLVVLAVAVICIILIILARNIKNKSAVT